MKKKVYVMMSGGVDSSVAAYLLSQNKDFDVKGVFMKCWSIEKLREKGFSDDLYACNWEEDEIDASMIAKKLNIPFETWDFQNEYADQVIDYMINEYALGRTPNPDVMCNSIVKFGVFYEKAMQEGADFVATGHYARIIDSEGKFYIAKALDEKKDQSYFLWKIPRICLSHTLLPIGELEDKAVVREIAKINNLTTFDKKDSQGLCFVGKSNLNKMLTQRIGEKTGKIVTKDFVQAKQATRITKAKQDSFNKTGFVEIGEHLGAYHFTIGQRDKLGISGGPWYVSKIDIITNTVEVIHLENIDNLNRTEFYIDGLNSFDDLENITNLNCLVRYNQDPIDCKIDWKGEGRVKVILSVPTILAIGQSCVIFDDQKLVLGGIICYV
ncbi:MAG: tRNA 2-thiouridine(34) synthase MnmA [Patescibacteria group bacterium]